MVLNDWKVQRGKTMPSGEITNHCSRFPRPLPGAPIQCEIDYTSVRVQRKTVWTEQGTRFFFLLLLLAAVDLISIAWHWSNIPLCIADRCWLGVGGLSDRTGQDRAHEWGWLGPSPTRDVPLIQMPFSVIGMEQMLWLWTLAYLHCFCTGCSLRVPDNTRQLPL